MARYCQWVLMHLNAFIFIGTMRWDTWKQLVQPSGVEQTPSASHPPFLYLSFMETCTYHWQTIASEVLFKLSYSPTLRLCFPRNDHCFFSLNETGASLMFSIVLSQYYSFPYGKPKHLKVESSAVENCNLYKKNGKRNSSQPSLALCHRERFKLNTQIPQHKQDG